MEGAQPSGPPKIYMLASANIKFIRPAFPGETLRLKARAEKRFGALHRFAVEASAGRKLVAEGHLLLGAAEQPG